MLIIIIIIISTAVGRTVQVHFAFEGFVALKRRVEVFFCVTSALPYG
jgi:peroxiredoxin family protein